MTSTSSTRVRMTPEHRREQLLDHGVRLLSTRTLDELSIDLLAEEAGISRGLLYHYFGNKQEFHVAVVKRAVDDLLTVTAPDGGDDLLGVLTRSLEAYVDYVAANRTGFISLVRAAGSGDEQLRALYDEARASLTGRMFEKVDGVDGGVEALGYTDTPATRMLVRSWSSLAESLVLEWTDDARGMTKDDLLGALVATLVASLEAAR